MKKRTLLDTMTLLKRKALLSRKTLLNRQTLFRCAVAVGCLLPSALVTGPLEAQEEATSVEDPLFRTLFPPELIMQHRRAIGLNDEQRDAISRLISDLQGRVLSLQWELSAEVQELATITGRPRVDLDRALDQMDSVLETEKQIKQAHLEMLVRIKNILTPEQQATLEELKGQGG